MEEESRPAKEAPERIIAQVLKRARELVAAGFVVERDVHSAEDADGNLTRYTDPYAARFTPSTAIWRAEYEIFRNIHNERERGRLHDAALRYFAETAPQNFAQEYRRARQIETALGWFDVAIARAEKPRPAPRYGLW